MKKLELKVEEFALEANMRCQGMCKGSCSCPTGHCKCKVAEYNISNTKYAIPSSTYFTK